ncbi:PAS domain S-box protein [Halovenus marina]|uniref:PAS domain-containing sensor histidine kinase n=1 Tax=Halovenus marina TaxID=3396621 RepID=UPI003F572C57
MSAETNLQTVLYVDDDRERCDSVQSHLNREFHETRVTTSGSDAAVDACERAAPDCVVSRYELAGTDGVELLERMRARWPDLPVVLFTAAGSEAVAEQAVSAGVTAYVRASGSESVDRLVERIDAALESSRESTDSALLREALEETVLVYDPARDDPDRIREAVCDHWGHSPEECDSRQGSPQAQIQPEPSRSVAEWVDRARTEGTQRFEWPCTTLDGREFWAEVTLNPISQEGDDQLVVVVRDITAQRRKAQRLQAFQEAVEHAGHSIYITDVDGEIEYVNDAFETATGYSEREAVGQTPSLLKSGKHDEEYYEQLWETILTGETWEDELVNEHKDGSRYIANQTIAPITDETGEVVRFVAVNADITEQKRREQQLQTLYEATAEWLDADSKTEVCAMASDQLAALLEFDEHGFHLYDEATGCLEPIAVSAGEAIPTDDVPAFAEGEGIAWRVYETGEARRYDDVRTDPDAYNPDTDARSELIVPLGDHGVLLVSSAAPEAFTETDETIVKVLASMLAEVLTRIDRESELEQQNSRLQEFANLVSHDLRNPLSVARAHLDLAKESGDLDHLADIETAHDRMERIIEDLLWLAREGRAIGQTETVDLPNLVEQAWSHVDTPEATLLVACEGEITADEDRLQQLFENLFRNSIEHGGSDVALRIGSLDDGFFVEDDGPGIPVDEREQVLDPGYSTAEESTGYGLAVVDRIVDAHGWSLTITDADDGGARFEVRNVGQSDPETQSWCS